MNEDIFCRLNFDRRPSEPPESAVARMIAGLEMLLREACEAES